MKAYVLLFSSRLLYILLASSALLPVGSIVVRTAMKECPSLTAVTLQRSYSAFRTFMSPALRLIARTEYGHNFLAAGQAADSVAGDARRVWRCTDDPDVDLHSSMSKSHATSPLAWTRPVQFLLLPRVQLHLPTLYEGQRYKSRIVSACSAHPPLLSSGPPPHAELSRRRLRFGRLTRHTPSRMRVP